MPKDRDRRLSRGEELSAGVGQEHSEHPRPLFFPPQCPSGSGLLGIHPLFCACGMGVQYLIQSFSPLIGIVVLTAKGLGSNLGIAEEPLCPTPSSVAFLVAPLHSLCLEETGSLPQQVLLPLIPLWILDFNHFFLLPPSPSPATDLASSGWDWWFPPNPGLVIDCFY